LAGWKNFQSVITGFEVVNEQPKPAVETSSDDEKA
jgi:hypothetical protein